MAIEKKSLVKSLKAAKEVKVVASASAMKEGFQRGKRCE